MSPEIVRDVAIGLVLLTACISAAAVLYPLTRAFARRLEGGHGSDRSGERVEELNARVSELEGQVTRMQELEDRLDFTERMLARQQGLRLTSGQREEAR